MATGGDPTLTAFTVFGWMVLPTIGLVYTGRVLPRDDKSWAYTVGGALSGVGALLFLTCQLPVRSLGLVDVGQTLGILAAVRTY